MEQSARQILDAVELTARCLLTPKPHYADSTMVLLRIIAEKTRSGEIPEGPHWTQVIEGPSTYFIFASEEGGGRHARALPADVDPATVVRIQVDPNERPVTAVLDDLGTLIAHFADGKSPTISGTNEQMTFVGTQAEIDAMPMLLEYVGCVRAACEPDFNAMVLDRQSDRLQEAFGKIVIDGSGGVITKFHEICDITFGMHDRSAVDAELAAWMLIYKTLPDAVFRLAKERGQLDGIAEAERIRFVSYGGLARHIKDTKLRSHEFIRKAAREGLWELAAKIADDFQGDGHALVETALNASRLKEHQAALYKSAPLFCAAYWIFQALSDEPRLKNIPDTLWNRYCAAAVESNEDLVRVGHALLNSFEDRMGEKTEMRKAHLRWLALEKGQDAADDKLFQWTEMQYFYPRTYESVLRSAASIRDHR